MKTISKTRFIKLRKEFEALMRPDMSREMMVLAAEVDEKQVYPVGSPHSGIDIFYLWLLKHYEK